MTSAGRSLQAIKVGMCASLSGQFQEQGKQALQGVAAWVEDVNALGGVFVGDLCVSLPLSLIHCDDQSRAAQVRELTRHLIVEDRVDLLLGPYSSGLTLATAEVAEEYEKVLWNHGGSADGIHTRGFRWTVSILSPASQYLTGVVDLVRQAYPAAFKVAIVHSASGSFSASVAQGAATRALDLGLQIVYQGMFPSPCSDFSLLLDQVAGAKPDLLIGVGRIGDDLLLAEQMAPNIAGMVALVATPIDQFRQRLGARVNGFVGPSQWEESVALTPNYGPTVEAMVRRLSALSDGGVDYPMAQGYVGGLVAQRCIEVAGSLDDSKLRQAAGSLDFTTFYGRFKIEAETGKQVGHTVLLVQWQGGEKVIVWPPELAQAQPIYRWAR